MGGIFIVTLTQLPNIFPVSWRISCHRIRPRIAKQDSFIANALRTAEHMFSRSLLHHSYVSIAGNGVTRCTMMFHLLSPRTYVFTCVYERWRYMGRSRRRNANETSANLLRPKCCFKPSCAYALERISNYVARALRETFSHSGRVVRLSGTPDRIQQREILVHRGHDRVLLDTVCLKILFNYFF